MKRIGIFYSFNSNKTAKVGEKIIEAFGKADIEAVNAEEVNEENFTKYDNIIVGVPTWFDGELPNYWDEFVPALEDLDLKGKKVAIYGLGDQKGYPENFNDGVGIFAGLVESAGGEVVGFTSRDGYTYEGSRAERGELFCGLCIDQENQARLTKGRIEKWVEELKKVFY
ncbi:flavodoxin [Gaoshiqia sp. Z1-71]|uniref:flavodoxin n=1 Tax=Gaoshiqia hydrogeniformans TaxID=3290090 RepID=UPI003BF7CBA2